MLRIMIRQGFKKKENSWAFILTKNDIYNRCKTDTLSRFIKKQQERFMTKVIRSEDDSVIKRIFNNDASHQRGPKRSLLQSVVANSNSQEAEFFKKALAPV